MPHQPPPLRPLLRGSGTPTTPPGASALTPSSSVGCQSRVSGISEDSEGAPKRTSAPCARSAGSRGAPHRRDTRGTRTPPIRSDTLTRVLRCPVLFGCPSVVLRHPPPPPTDALEGNAPQRRPQRRLGRRLEEVAKAVGSGYCRLQMPLTLGILQGRGGGGGAGWYLTRFRCVPAPAPASRTRSTWQVVRVEERASTTPRCATDKSDGGHWHTRNVTEGPGASSVGYAAKAMHFMRRGVGGGGWNRAPVPDRRVVGEGHVWKCQANRGPKAGMHWKGGRSPPCVTFRRVVAPLRGPGRSPVLPFACCVGSLLSVGRCGRCSCWCRFRVRGAQ